MTPQEGKPIVLLFHCPGITLPCEPYSLGGIITCLVGFLLLVWGCGDNKSQTQQPTKVVSKKIAVQPQADTGTVKAPAKAAKITAPVAKPRKRNFKRHSCTPFDSQFSRFIFARCPLQPSVSGPGIALSARVRRKDRRQWAGSRCRGSRDTGKKAGRTAEETGSWNFSPFPRPSDNEQERYEERDESGGWELRTFTKPP